jgi:hypothetical protein
MTGERLRDFLVTLVAADILRLDQYDVGVSP